MFQNLFSLFYQLIECWSSFAITVVDSGGIGHMTRTISLD